jgi:hypothetical protein
LAGAFKDYLTIPKNFGTVMVIEKEFGPAGADDWADMANSMPTSQRLRFF